MQSKGTSGDKTRNRGLEKLEPANRVVTQMMAKQFRVAAEQGLFPRVRLESDWTNFRVVGEMEGGLEAVMWMAKLNSPRTFANPAAALAELRKMGVTRVEVVMAEWDVEQAVLSMRQRPDVVARRLRRGRMTEAEQILEASKKDPSLVKYVPEGTQEMGPVDRWEERGILVDEKLLEMSRKAEEEGARYAEAERERRRVEEERAMAADRAWSDAICEDMYRMTQELKAGPGK